MFTSFLPEVGGKAEALLFLDSVCFISIFWFDVFCEILLTFLALCYHSCSDQYFMCRIRLFHLPLTAGILLRKPRHLAIFRWVCSLADKSGCTVDLELSIFYL